MFITLSHTFKGYILTIKSCTGILNSDTMISHAIGD